MMPRSFAQTPKVATRDVQATEFVGGFCLTKDMAKATSSGLTW